MMHYNAAQCYRQALLLNEGLHGNEAPAVAETLHDLGELLHRRGRLQEAESLHVKALRIREAHSLSDSIAESCLNLSLLVGKMGRTREAEHYQAKVAAIKEEQRIAAGQLPAVADSRGGRGTNRRRQQHLANTVGRSIASLPGSPA
jgi:tetratricopeptide (TPR) repeat protein